MKIYFKSYEEYNSEYKFMLEKYDFENPNPIIYFNKKMKKGSITIVDDKEEVIAIDNSLGEIIFNNIVELFLVNYDNGEIKLSEYDDDFYEAYKEL